MEWRPWPPCRRNTSKMCKLFFLWNHNEHHNMYSVVPLKNYLLTFTALINCFVGLFRKDTNIPIFGQTYHMISLVVQLLRWGMSDCAAKQFFCSVPLKFFANIVDIPTYWHYRIYCCSLAIRIILQILFLKLFIFRNHNTQF